MKEKHPYDTIVTLAQKKILKEMFGPDSYPDGPRKDALMLYLTALEKRDDAEDLKTLDIRRRLETLYFDELKLRDWPNDGSVEELILEWLSAAFIVVRGADRTHKLFATFAKKPKKQRPDSARPRTGLTDKKTFVRAFLYSNQTKYAFAKRVAEINAALPPGDRFGCLSTTREDVETQLDRALKEWEAIVRKEIGRGQR